MPRERTPSRGPSKWRRPLRAAEQAQYDAPTVDSVTTVRPPLYTERRAPPPQQGYAVPNLLLTTLAVAVAATVVQHPPVYTPRVAPRVQYAELVPNRLPLTSVAPEAAPFAQYAWEVPAAVAPARVEEVQRAPTLPSVVVPFYQAAWPAPCTRAPQRPDVAQNLLRSTLAPLEPTPFYQSDWAAPTRQRALRPDAQGSALLWQQVAAPAPFAQYDWPSPARPAQLPPWELGTSLALLSAPVVAGTPFVPFSFEVARGYQRGETLTWVQHLLQGPLAPPAAPPPTDTDWLVRARRRGRR